MIDQQLSIVFPGQGSQSVGMLADIAVQYPEVKKTFVDASDVLHYDMWQLVQEGPADQLDKTMYTQPALLTASYAIWQILQTRLGVAPTLIAGHSLGEYTALVCANALTFADAVKLVAARGEYMQDAVASGVGAMAAIIGLDDAKVKEICDQARLSNEVLSPANFNSIGQVVVAGHKASVDRAIVIAKEQGARMAMLIPVSVPSHCELMLPAAKRLAVLLNEISIKKPQLSVISNVDVIQYDTEDSIRNGLTRQLSMPVRWVETVQFFIGQGITQIIECGPSKILTGLNKRIDKNLQLMPTSDLAGLEAVLNVSK